MYWLQNRETELEMNHAIIFLAKHVEASCHNPKPIVTHSVMVGTTLYELGYSNTCVIGGLLHDLIEDTVVTKTMIAQEFGQEIADLVAALSFDSAITDYLTQTKSLFNQIRQYGTDAMIVKCADLYCNLPFLDFAQTEQLKENLKRKYQLFISEFREYIGSENLFLKLEKRLNSWK